MNIRCNDELFIGFSRHILHGACLYIASYRRCRLRPACLLLPNAAPPPLLTVLGPPPHWQAHIAIARPATITYSVMHCKHVYSPYVTDNYTITTAAKKHRGPGITHNGGYTLAQTHSMESGGTHDESKNGDRAHIDRRGCETHQT